MKSITFLMPGTGKDPSGGIKVIYEQANRLVEKSYDVNIVYPIHTFIKRKTIRNILGIIRRYILGFMGESYKCKWFELSPKIHEIKVYNLNQKYMPISDYYCATSLETSYFLDKYFISPDKKIYYIQGYETWNIGEPYTSNSYKFDMKKIAIAPYLVKKVTATGNNAVLIPNGFDFDAFGIDCPIENRNPHIGMMMYSSNNNIKRCSDAIAAFKIVKEKIPDLEVLVFGTPKRPADLPEWFIYYQKPEKKLLRSLYNRASIFVAASVTEGMALPPAEAFICGCALCCTDIEGFEIYAIQEKTALLSHVFDIQALSDNIYELMINTNKRILFAMNGNKILQEYTWEKANDKFLKVIES